MRLTVSFLVGLAVDFFKSFFSFTFATCGAICPSIAFLSIRALAVLNMY